MADIHVHIHQMLRRDESVARHRHLRHNGGPLRRRALQVPREAAVPEQRASEVFVSVMLCEFVHTYRGLNQCMSFQPCEFVHVPGVKSVHELSSLWVCVHVLGVKSVHELSSLWVYAHVPGVKSLHEMPFFEQTYSSVFLIRCASQSREATFLRALGRVFSSFVANLSLRHFLCITAKQRNWIHNTACACSGMYIKRDSAIVRRWMLWESTHRSCWD